MLRFTEFHWWMCQDSIEQTLDILLWHHWNWTYRTSIKSRSEKIRTLSRLRFRFFVKVANTGSAIRTGPQDAVTVSLIVDSKSKASYAQCSESSTVRKYPTDIYSHRPTNQTNANENKGKRNVYLRDEEKRRVPRENTQRPGSMCCTTEVVITRSTRF